MGNIGLVFAGGGGKGAYEIGVWKYLHEIGFDRHVCAVSGTSVGALNAALFVGGSYELAEEIWLNISPKQIMSPKKIKMEDMLLAVSYYNLSKITRIGPLNASSVVLGKTSTMGAEALAGMLVPMTQSDSWFSRDGLREMIERIDFHRFYGRNIPCYATCVKWPSIFHPSLALERFKLNIFSKGSIFTILLASSAIPVLFPKEKFRKKYYYDGGLPIVGDNVPIQPVYDEGAKYIIVVHLDKKDKPTEKDKYPCSKVIDIIPSVDLGNKLTGTVDFTAKGAKKRLDLGYEDAKKVIGQSFKGEWIGGKIFN